MMIFTLDGVLLDLKVFVRIQSAAKDYLDLNLATILAKTLSVAL